jgi:hypothetical protein
MVLQVQEEQGVPEEMEFPGDMEELMVQEAIIIPTDKELLVPEDMVCIQLTMDLAEAAEALAEAEAPQLVQVQERIIVQGMAGEVEQVILDVPEAPHF